MKKLTVIFLTLAMTAVLAAGCGSAPAQASASAPASSEPASAPAEAAPSEAASSEPAASEPAEAAAPVDVNVLALKGPTAMGMVRFMQEAEDGKTADNNYSFSIVAAVDEVAPKLVQGQADIAAVPANLASVLYNNTKGGVQVLAINTLGVLYIVESGDTVQSIADLKGKTIYASGKGATPEYALNYILAQNGLTNDVTIEWKSEHAECLSVLATTPNAIAMLPQPFVTTAQTKAQNIRVALDLTGEWDALQAGAAAPSALITGVVVGRTEFVNENPQAVSAFLDHYKASVEFVNANTADAAALVGKYDIVPAAIAEKALPKCNIAFIEGSEMKAKLVGYLSVLFEQNPKSVGGALPTDEFYYSR